MVSSPLSLRVPIESFLWVVSIISPERIHFLFFYSLSIWSWWVICLNSWSLIALVHHIFQLTWVICWHMSAVFVLFLMFYSTSHIREASSCYLCATLGRDRLSNVFSSSTSTSASSLPPVMSFRHLYVFFTESGKRTAVFGVELRTPKMKEFIETVAVVSQHRGNSRVHLEKALSHYVTLAEHRDR